MASSHDHAKRRYTQKKIYTYEKSLNSHKIGLVHQHCCCEIMQKPRYSRSIGSVDATPSITRNHFTRNFDINIIFTDENHHFENSHCIVFSILFRNADAVTFWWGKDLFQDSDKFAEMVNSVIMYINTSDATLQL